MGKVKIFILCFSLFLVFCLIFWVWHIKMKKTALQIEKANSEKKEVLTPEELSEQLKITTRKIDEGGIEKGLEKLKKDLSPQKNLTESVEKGINNLFRELTPK